MTILVLGAGMVAHYLKPYEPHFASRSSKEWQHFQLVDIRHVDALRDLVSKLDPDIIINAAAISRIRECEMHANLAEEVNHQGQRNVIKVCNEIGIKIIYLSTSSVFSGQKGNYTEEDIPNPTTVYGKTKLMGERITKREARKWAIFRLTSIYGDYPDEQDFIQQLVTSLKMGRTYACWDQVISPSYGPFVAEAMMRLIEKEVNGIWHIAGNERLTRYEIGTIVRKKVGKGKIMKTKTPEGLPPDRSLNTKKLQTALPDLELPEFERNVNEIVNEMVMKTFN